MVFSQHKWFLPNTYVVLTKRQKNGGPYNTNLWSLQSKIAILHEQRFKMHESDECCLFAYMHYVFLLFW